MKPIASGSLLGIENMDPDRILALLRSAKRMNPARKSRLLRGRRVVLLFYEASTRTRVSFEFAAKALGTTTTVVNAAASSIEKGESLIDTGLTLRALGADVIVVRHPSSGAPDVLARTLDCPIINAGDGMHEHPSQALLDAFTILEHKKTLKNLRISIVGDVFHSRVARSNIHLLTKFGAKVTLCGPPELAPPIAKEVWPTVQVTDNLQEALSDAEVVLLLRIQKERLKGLELDPRDYQQRYQLNRQTVKLAPPNAIVMHPGPIIRGMEITDEVADGIQSVIISQISNGVRVRMAILAETLGHKPGYE